MSQSRQIGGDAKRVTLARVQVDIGPVEAASATAFIDYARAVLEGYGLEDEPIDGQIGTEVAKRFRGYLDEWARVAKRGGEFKWTTDIELEQVEYLVYAFYRVAGRATEAAQARGRRLMPIEADAFYESLVQGLLHALEAAGTPAAEFADELRQFWPRFS